MPILKGRLIVAPVSGLGYRTATQCGVTNCIGEFRYLHGEQVTFFIGEAVFPSAIASPVVTPYDMGASPNEPINIIRLLHTLCRVNNGMLSISASAQQAAKAPIDFSIEPFAFAYQPAVTNLITPLGGKMIDERTAVELLDSMIACYVNGSSMDSLIKLWISAPFALESS